ncbi:class I SAM-dependent methyltransferase [bacterium]|nr:class I SAM-dependent methyltransferase [bacterium]
MEFDIAGYMEYAALSLLVVVGLFIFFAITIFISSFWGAPWVISSRYTIARMLKIANVQPGETVIDLGSGDGRVLIVAIQDFQAKGIGVEIDPLRWMVSKIFLARRGLSKSAKVIWGNLFTADITQADVVTLYLTRETNLRLKPYLEGSLKPGTRVVSNGFTIPGWTAIKIDNQNLIFLYEIGRTGENTITEFISAN